MKRPTRLITTGATRLVLLWRGYAIKVPAFHRLRQGVHGKRAFINGLLSNLQERVWWDTKDPRLCPVLWSSSLGFFVVMRRADPIVFDEVYENAMAAGYFHGDEVPEGVKPTLDLRWVTDDDKAENFGMIDGRLVCVDYGHCF